MKKTILFVHQSSDLYGSDKALLLLIKKLDKNLFRSIIVLPGKGPLYDEFIKNNFRVIITPVLHIHKRIFLTKELLLFPFNLVKSIIKLNKELKGEKIDIVQSNTVVVTLGFLYAKLNRISHFWHIHEVLDKPKIAVIIFSWFVKYFSDLTVFNSHTTQESFCKFQPSIRKNAVVIYNGIDRDETIKDAKELNELKKSLSIGINNIILGLVGRINENKGHLILLNSLTEVRRKNPSVKLIFIGSTVKGKEYVLDNLKNQIKELDLENDVIIIPFQKNIWKFWDIIDIAIVPSTIPESFGLVALEAMLSKKPVIASNLGALKEVVQDHKTGLLFNVDEVESIVKSVNLLIENKKLRLAYGEAGLERAKSVFTLEKYINQFEKIYLRN